MEIFSEDRGLYSLQDQLLNAGVNIDSWGKGEAKSLGDLQKEIDEGESVLINEDEKLLRKVTVCTANVYYLSPDHKKYRLKEGRQVFKDGRERRRALPQGVSGKMKAYEDPRNAMAREIKEELGLEGEVSLVDIGSDIKTINSPSYPGLQSQYLHYYFDSILTDQQFKFEGYIEEQDGLMTYFNWEEVV
jgi:hypothetical protein